MFNHVTLKLLVARVFTSFQTDPLAIASEDRDSGPGHPKLSTFYTSLQFKAAKWRVFKSAVALLKLLLLMNWIARWKELFLNPFLR